MKYQPPNLFYATQAYRNWRDEVIANAGGRCEEIEGGQRCERIHQHEPMFAVHIIKPEDGGSLYDIANGICLCYRHYKLVG